MFFFLAKVFWFLLQPLNLTIILLGVALAAMTKGRQRVLKVIVGAAFATLILSTWTSLGALMINPLQDRFSRPDPPPASVDGIIVLGGAFEGAVNSVRHGYEINSAGDRYIEAIALAHRYPLAKVVVTGGNGMLFLDGEGDGVTAARLFDAVGVARDRLVLESASRDTYENAVFTKRLVDPKLGQRWLLVTSAFHMPRSMALFERAGFDVLPWPVDYRTTGREGVTIFPDNPLDCLQTTTVAVREWIGLFAYWLSGRIDSPFPGPGSMSPASTTSRASE